MGYETPDVYYNPEKFDLEIVGQLDDPEADYSFDDLVVFQHKTTKALYYATDSGCSCPAPFEDYTSIESLGDPITDENWAEFQKNVEGHALREWRKSTEPDPQAADKTELLAKVARLLAAQS